MDTHTIVYLVAAGWLLLLAQLTNTKNASWGGLLIWKFAPTAIALATIYFAVN